MKTALTPNRARAVGHWAPGVHGSGPQRPAWARCASRAHVCSPSRAVPRLHRSVARTAPRTFTKPWSLAEDLKQPHPAGRANAALHSKPTLSGPRPRAGTHTAQLLQHRAGSCGGHNLGNTSPNAPLWFLKQAFVYAVDAGKKYHPSALSAFSCFHMCRAGAPRLLSLCRANAAFAGIKLCLYKLLRMPSWASDRGKTSGKNLLFLSFQEI